MNAGQTPSGLKRPGRRAVCQCPHRSLRGMRYVEEFEPAPIVRLMISGAPLAILKVVKMGTPIAV